IWTWDHFFPLYDNPNGAHFEGWALLAAMAADTRQAQIGILVSCNTYRNPDLLADMARTVDHLSEGRTVLGIGAGWSERDYAEYGYEFATAGRRLQDLEASLGRIRSRLARLVPPPVGRLPILIGGGGEKVTLRLVAQHADMWNLVTSDPGQFRAKNEALTAWCEREKRNPEGIERTVLFESELCPDPSAFVDAGARHLIMEWRHPYGLEAPLRFRESLA
ncbi:MAG: LLM class F420-dependent oxidoreductase, partial [Candidatus Dormibacteraeota bacterium]|nr:LLM class F420-dependent oxidoreductase [Candidatus Dormibacteraeota bacterium]